MIVVKGLKTIHIYNLFVVYNEEMFHMNDLTAQSWSNTRFMPTFSTLTCHGCYNIKIRCIVLNYNDKFTPPFFKLKNK